MLKGPERKVFFKFGLLFMLYFFNATLDELTVNPFPGPDCIYLGRWMIPYTCNKFWA